MKLSLLAVMLTLAVYLGTAEGPAVPIAYRVTPEMKEGALAALDVEIRFNGNSEGVTRLHLPDEFAGQSELWRQVADLTVEGAEISEAGPSVRLLRHKPGVPLVVRYRVVPAYGEDPKGEAGLPNRALIRPTWFGVLGEVVFAIPEGRAHAPATFTWGPAPSGWVMASDLDHPTPLTLETLVESFLYGGTDIRLSKLQVAGGPVRLAMRGHWNFSDGELADLLARIVVVERQFWKDPNTAFFVPLVPLTPLPEGTLHAGIGRGDAFVLYSTTDSSLEGFRWELAHEHMHTWIPREVGGLPEKDEVLDYWFSEGFADFYAARALLHSGIWSLEDFISEQNEMLERYGNSPNPLPNAQILKEFWTSDVVRQAPYDRGRMLATIWDYRLRQSNSSRSLNEVLKEQRLSAHENQRNHREVPAAKLFLELYNRISGTDLAGDVARFVEKGELVTLPSDVYGSCARVGSVTEAGKPTFQKLVQTPKMTPKVRADCIAQISNF
jgi:predicted metalloprotease with PDZ domain